MAHTVNVMNNARSQTTFFTYDFYGQKPNDLTFQGDAHFPSGANYLRLTKTDGSGNPLGNSIGRVVFTIPIQFWETGSQVDFQTTVKFRITTINNNPGDGLVFFIAPVGTTIVPGHSGSNFGVFETSLGRNPSIFAVEFDTYVNADVDPPYRHIGIDIQNLRSAHTVRVDDEILDREVTAVIQYSAAQQKIRVAATTSSRSFEFSYDYDLSTVLNQQVQVGLAAATGESVAIHDVMAWNFTATLVRPGNAAV